MAKLFSWSTTRHQCDKFVQLKNGICGVKNIYITSLDNRVTLFIGLVDTTVLYAFIYVIFMCTTAFQQHITNTSCDL